MVHGCVFNIVLQTMCLWSSIYGTGSAKIECGNISRLGQLNSYLFENDEDHFIDIVNVLQFIDNVTHNDLPNMDIYTNSQLPNKEILPNITHYGKNMLFVVVYAFTPCLGGSGSISGASQAKQLRFSLVADAPLFNARHIYKRQSNAKTG